MDKKEAAKDWAKFLRAKVAGLGTVGLACSNAQEIADLLDPPITPPEVPEGYEWREKEYRAPMMGEEFIGVGGDVSRAGNGWTDSPCNYRYIIYPIPPKFKPGQLVKYKRCIRVKTIEGWRGIDGAAGYCDCEDCPEASDADIQAYIKAYPSIAVDAIRRLARFEAKEAQQ